MRTLMLSVICSASLLAGCQEKEKSEETPAPATTQSSALPGTGEIQLAAFKDKELEVGCGMCIYEMDGVDGCKTAAVVNGKPVLLKGMGETAHSLGLCGDKGHAVVSGAVTDGTLVATNFEMKE